MLCPSVDGRRVLAETPGRDQQGRLKQPRPNLLTSRDLPCRSFSLASPDPAQIEQEAAATPASRLGSVLAPAAVCINQERPPRR